MTSMQGVTPDPLCDCSGQLHRIDCLTTAVNAPHAMINNEGEVFYPDSEEDAAWFAREHDAYPLASYLNGARR